MRMYPCRRRVLLYDIAEVQKDNDDNRVLCSFQLLTALDSLPSAGSTVEMPIALIYVI